MAQSSIETQRLTIKTVEQSDFFEPPSIYFKIIGKYIEYICIWGTSKGKCMQISYHSVEKSLKIDFVSNILEMFPIY